MTPGASPVVRRVAWLLLALLAGHDLTHALDDGLDTPLGALTVIAIPQWLAIAFVMREVIRGEGRRSADAALLLGVVSVVGFAGVHLLPFSAAPYRDLDPSGLSWALAWLPAAIGVLLAALAWRERATRGRADGWPAASEPSGAG
jgi:hypothetical protein